MEEEEEAEGEAVEVSRWTIGSGENTPSSRD